LTAFERARCVCIGAGRILSADIRLGAKKRDVIGTPWNYGRFADGL